MLRVRVMPENPVKEAIPAREALLYILRLFFRTCFPLTFFSLQGSPGETGPQGPAGLKGPIVSSRVHYLSHFSILYSSRALPDRKAKRV